MLSDDLPDLSGLYYALILILCILNSVVSICKRSLDYIDRGYVKELLEHEPDNGKLSTVKFFLTKPSKYHYADHVFSFLMIIFVFAVFNLVILHYENFYWRLLYNVIFFIIYTALFDNFPKKLAAQASEKYGLKFIRFQYVIYIITYPIVALCRLISNILLMIMGKETDVDDSYFSEEKVLSMLDSGQESGVIKEDGRKMINSIFQFDDLLAYEIMTPRTDVFMIDINDEPSEYFDEIMELTHSRIPVYKDDADNIIGILHIKDYLHKAVQKGFDNINLSKIIRPAYFVPETKNIDSLFKELQVEKQHLAILIDEYGGFSGLVSVEDIIEQIVGDIDDEFDEVDRVIFKENENTYILDGNVYLDDLAEETPINLESDTSETIGGFIIDFIGEIPRENIKYDPITYENYIFTILEVKDRRIEKVKIIIDDKTNVEEEKS